MNGQCYFNDHKKERKNLPTQTFAAIVIVECSPLSDSIGMYKQWRNVTCKLTFIPLL